MRIILPFAIAALFGCTAAPTPFEDIDSAERAAPYPDLVPLAPLLAQAAAQATEVTEQTSADLQSRVARLQARASGLRGPVVGPATRAQMRDAIARAALR